MPEPTKAQPTTPHGLARVLCAVAVVATAACASPGAQWAAGPTPEERAARAADALRSAHTARVRGELERAIELAEEARGHYHALGQKPAEAEALEAQALRRAQLDVLRATADGRSSHPYFWAAFMLIGDGQRAVTRP